VECLWGGEEGGFVTGDDLGGVKVPALHEVDTNTNKTQHYLRRMVVYSYKRREGI